MTKNYMKSLNNLGTSQVVGGPGFPKPDICMAHSSADNCAILSCREGDCLRKIGFLQKFYPRFYSVFSGVDASHLPEDKDEEVKTCH